MISHPGPVVKPRPAFLWSGHAVTGRTEKTGHGVTGPQEGRPRLMVRRGGRKIPATLPRAERTARMRHVLSALVQNQPGVLAHVSGMLASRGFNIDSLAVGETEKPDLSRMTFVVHGDDAELEQVRKQLDKIVTVVKVQDISGEDFVERDLMLLKVRCAPPQRNEIV